MTNYSPYPIAVFAGRGALPKILLEEFAKKNQKFVLFLLKDENYQIDYSSHNPITIPYGEVENFLAILRKNEVKNIIFIGGVTKPNFSSIKVDKKGAILLAKILASKVLGDDYVLKTVVKFFEKEGFKFLQIQDLLQDIIAKKGILTTVKPSAEDLSNIDLAKEAIHAMSKFDIGQSMIVAQKQIIAVEAVEGTDQIIKRCATLNIDYKNQAILVKMKKRNQSTKADLPTIGLETINNCHNSHIKGIAFQASSTLIIEKEEVIKLANQLNIFLTAI